LASSGHERTFGVLAVDLEHGVGDDAMCSVLDHAAALEST